jgi:flagellar basal-body rod protein FlgB
MNPASIDIFALSEKRLAWIGQRQGVLAQNIANANTPGYVARDVKPFAEVLAAQTQQTESDSLIPISSGAAASSVPSTSGRSLDGNAVVLDQQLEKVAETDTAHQLASNLYKKYVSLFKTAIGRN